MTWYPKNNEIVGLAVSEDVLRSLHDLYASVKDEKGLHMESHILQFLWRDLSSNFDVIRTYFTSDSAMEVKFATSCVLEAMLSFESFHFGVRGLVCVLGQAATSHLWKGCVECQDNSPARQEGIMLYQHPSPPHSVVKECGSSFALLTRWALTI